LGVTLCPQARSTTAAKRGVLRIRDLAVYLGGELGNPLVFSAPQVPRAWMGLLDAGRSYTTRGLAVESKSLRPTCPSWLEPCLPIHITEHREALSGSSSGIISTICPRFR